MSHFTVMVIGENPEEQLQPFHEFECDGRIDEYVLSIDQTEEVKANYDKETRLRLKDPEGKLHDPYEDRFYRQKTEEEIKADPLTALLGTNKMIRFVPKGWTEVQVPVKDFQTLKEYTVSEYAHPVLDFGQQPDLEGTHKFGYIETDGEGNLVRVVDRTNPNSKWDWYLLGGRYEGKFKLKSGCGGKLGEPSLVRVAFDREYVPPSKNTADSAYKRDIDFDQMRHDAEEEAGRKYDAFIRVTEGCDRALPWEGVLAKYSEAEINKAREEYWDQPAIKALRADPETKGLYNYDDFLECSREEYLRQARANAIATYAIIKDGQWFERGKMGWWGMASNERDMSEWSNEFNKLLDSIPDDTLLSIYDCHI